MTEPPRDERLRDAYAVFLADRSQAIDPPNVPVETVQALAEGSYIGGDRMELLDRVLAHPATAREFHFFQDLAAVTPTPRRRVPSWVGLAAILVLAVGVGSAWWARRSHPIEPEPLRGGSTGVQVLIREGAAVGRGDRLVWRAGGAGTRYRVELLDRSGGVVFRGETGDTELVVSTNAPITAGAGYLVSVVARADDGTETRGAPVTVVGR